MTMMRGIATTEPAPTPPSSWWGGLFSRLRNVGILLLMAVAVFVAGSKSGLAVSDTDGDGFADSAETSMGTDPASPCSLTVAPNDEAVDGWPPDFDDNTKVDIVDAAAFRSKFGLTSVDAGYSPRFDLNGDGLIDLLDVSRLRTEFDKTCTPTLPVLTDRFVGQYYNNSDLTALRFVRYDPAINFNWGAGSPNALIDNTTYSVRWTGDFNFFAGSYTFTATVDDGVKVWVDGSVALDQQHSQGAALTFQRTLTTGVHRLIIEYSHSSGSAKAQLQWALDQSGPTAGSRLPWQGENSYLLGVNVPWYNWQCDFGCGTDNGVSNAGNKAQIAAKFAELKAAGVHNVRWWVFPGDPWQISRDPNGAPTGMNSQIYPDFDTALQLANQYDLYFSFTLFGGPMDLSANWINDPTQRTQLASVLGQLFAHYRNNPRILSWQIFNEPEWAMWNNQVSTPNMQALVTAIAASIHSNSNAYASVGSAMLDGLSLWTGAGLDFYDAHWYDYMSSGNWCARCTDYSTVKDRYHLDKPVVIGEFYGGTDTDALQRFEDWYSKGFAGAWAWSLFPDHTSDHLNVDLGAAQTFASSHSDIGP